MGVNMDNRMRLIMKYSGLKLVLLIVALFFSITAIAQANSSKRVVRRAMQQSQPLKVSTEFGLGVGARYNWFNVQPISEVFTPKITMRVSYGAALQFRLNIGKTFGVQPEISYAYANINIKDKTNNFSAKSKFSMVQIPLLLSFRIAMFRINFGPVFTLMDNPTYQLVNTTDETIKAMPLGKIYPTVTYTAGISVKFARCMMLDVRYADQFMPIQSENSYIWTLDTTKQAEAQRFRTSSRSVQVRIGYAF